MKKENISKIAVTYVHYKKLKKASTRGRTSLSAEKNERKKRSFPVKNKAPRRTRDTIFHRNIMEEESWTISVILAILGTLAQGLCKSCLFSPRNQTVDSSPRSSMIRSTCSTELLPSIMLTNPSIRINCISYIATVLKIENFKTTQVK